MITFKIDVSRNWHNDRISAILIIKAMKATAKGMNTKGALARFRRSVSQWLANTDIGRKVWEASCHDYNYGDFREDDVAEDKDFIRILKANGLESVSVERYAAQGCGEHWDSTFTPEVS